MRFFGTLKLLDLADGRKIDRVFVPSPFKSVVEMRGVEFGFEQEGVVTFVRVHGDHHAGGATFFQDLGELRLFFGIEAEV